MNSTSDNELILYFYRDGLNPKRIMEIDDALFACVDLRTRYTQLQCMLHEVDAEPIIEADAGFTQRVWQKLATRIDATQSANSGWRVRLQTVRQSLLTPARLAFAATCLLLLAIGAGYYAGRWSVPGPDQGAKAGVNAMGVNVLDTYVAEHLRTTEGLLLTAVNSDSLELHAGNRDLAASLVDSNRLYALAAARSGNTRLADFLRQLEPVLLELANQPADASIQSTDGLRDYLRKTDLLFQVRATQARIDATGKHRT
jgi:hypothetical protein